MEFFGTIRYSTTRIGLSAYLDSLVTSRPWVLAPQVTKAPPCMYNTTRRLPSAGSTPAARTSCAWQRGSRMVARMVPGGGSIALAAKSTRPNGHGIRGK